MATETAISVSGLRKRFGSVVAVDGIDLEVAGATVFGLLGPNGAGKTTTIRALTTLLQPDSGKATVLGHDVESEARTVRRLIGLAGQFAAVDGNLTGRENLRLIGRLTHLSPALVKERADELLEIFGLSDAADRTVRTYSGGMKRRLDLGAALVHRPPVLFLDEPTTGLDPHSRADLWDVIRDLVLDGTTVLLTTQYLEEADRLADRIAVIDLGRVIAEGTSAELKSKLGNTVVEITLSEHAEVEQAARLLASFDVETPEAGNKTIRFKTNDGSRVLIEVLRRLDQEQIAPATLAVREPSLDDVFLSLTGKAPKESKDE